VSHGGEHRTPTIREYNISKLGVLEHYLLYQVVKDDFHQDLYIRIFGEVQKEVIEAVLKLSGDMSRGG